MKANPTTWVYRALFGYLFLHASVGGDIKGMLNVFLIALIVELSGAMISLANNFRQL